MMLVSTSVLAIVALANAATGVNAVQVAEGISAKDAAGLEIIQGLAALTSRQARSGPSRLDRRLLGGGSDYAPYAMPCPTDITWVRSASKGLSDGEKAYLEKRKQYLSSINTQSTSNGLSTPPRTPTIAVALSGGGYRAMTVGLGMVQGLMNASSESAAAGTGGWLDGTTYMAGLSGGSWATTAFTAHDGKLPIDMALDNMNLDSNLIVPEDGKVSFYTDLVSEVRAKANSNNGRFRTQITDYWGLALGNHLLPDAYHLGNSPNYTWSSLPSNISGLANGSLPMPIVIAAEREKGEYVIAENSTIYEFTPYEFGTWAMGSSEKVIGAFTPLEYLGSELNNGSANGTCYKGFDQVSFIAGTSSTLFNAALVQLGNSSDSIIASTIESILKDISDEYNDVALYPNAFAGWTEQTNPISDFEYITLIDAGETNQNVPLEPLLVHPRNVDAIFAFDNSADTDYSWPNGSSLRTTYERSLQTSIKQNIPMRMPVVPTTNGFVNGGLNTRPTFFGCNETDTPVIVYVPNYPWSYAANVSTFTFEFSDDAARGVVNNGMRSVTLNGSVSTWPQCLTCAMTDRAFGYTSSNRSTECAKCFDTFCWNGVDDQSTPSKPYEPVLGTVPEFLQNLTSGDTSAKGATTTSGTASTASSSSAARRRMNILGFGL